MEAIILAGGKGTRLGALTENTPKPMLPVNGVPFLERLMNYWKKQGVGRFILSTGYLGGKIRDYFQDERPYEIVLSPEEEPLGTGGGIIRAARYLEGKGPFLVLNGDTFFEADLKILKEFHSGKEADISLALFPLQDAKRFEGVVLEPSGKIKEWKERGSGGSYANGGVYLFEPRLLEPEKGAPRPVSLEKELLPKWQKEGRRIFGSVSVGRFIDIGTPEDYARASGFLRH